MANPPRLPSAAKKTPKKNPRKKITKVVDPLSSASISSRVKAIMQPQAALINQQAAKDIGAIKGFTTAEAALLKPIAGQIDEAYGRSADAAAGYGQGLSASLRDRLTAAGAEAGVDYQADPSGDIAYALGAMYPAQGMREQGAGFSAAARLQPAAALDRGFNAVTQRQQSAREALAELQAKAPEVFQSLLEAERDWQIKQRAQSLYEQQFGLDVQQEQRYADAAASKASEIDPSVSKILGYTADAQGNPVLGGKPVKNSSASKSASRASEKRGSAFDSARQDLFDDVQDFLIDNPDKYAVKYGGASAQIAGKTYEQARTILWNKHKGLLRYGSGAGKKALRARIMQMIDEALDSVGIKPAAKKRQSKTYAGPRDAQGQPDIISRLP